MSSQRGSAGSPCFSSGGLPRPSHPADGSPRPPRTCSPRAIQLTLVYLPHLDYALQRIGPDDPAIAAHLTEINSVAGDLIDAAQALGRRVVVLSEYGIVPVSKPVHINRALREAGLLAVREEQGGELLDIPRSRAFAVADHQLAHVYVAIVRRHRKGPRDLGEARRHRGAVFDEDGKRYYGLDNARSGELRGARGSGRLVHVLLLARRRPSAGFCPHGRDPSQAGIRPCRTVP